MTSLFNGLDTQLPELRAIYEDLHAHPELSFQEHRTAAAVAGRLREGNWEVTEGVGGTGVVGVLRNGDGPVVLLRADMDALPVAELTGLPYASGITATDSAGETVPVMHACGHDMHTTCLLGAAAQLAANLDAWRGTVVAVFQPAEEVGGAPAVIEDGFTDRFPRADVCLGQHVGPVPVGFVATRPGPVMCASDSMRITLFGKGGHGSMPEASVDPVVMAAAVVLRLQTVVAREVASHQTAVLTVGSINSGTKENIIPETAELKLGLRTSDPKVRDRVLEAIRRVTLAEAAASGAPKEPEFERLPSLPLTVNDARATETVRAALSARIGDGFHVLARPLNGSEDFGVFGEALGAPSVYWYFGGADPAAFAGANLADVLENGFPEGVPLNHSPYYAPVPEPTIEHGVTLLLTAAAAWLAPDAA